MSKQNKFKRIKASTSHNIPADGLAKATYGGNKALDQLFGGDTQTGDSGQGVLSLDNDGVYRFGRVGLTPVGLDIPDDVGPDEYAQLGRLLLDVGSRIQWLIGDWIVYGDHFQWGETYTSLADEFGYEVETLHTYAWVCRQVQISTRVEVLSFSHHRIVAKYEPQAQQRLLTMAVEQGWSAKEFPKHIRALEAGDTEQEQPPAWRRPALTAFEFYAKKWERMTSEERQQVHQDYKLLVKKMEEWGM
jgi:hypothetical protein